MRRLAVLLVTTSVGCGRPVPPPPVPAKPAAPETSPEEAPLVRGVVAHPGRPGQFLAVGYVELTGKDWLGDQIEVKLPAPGISKVRAESGTYKPRVASLAVPEDEPTRYEFTRLPPGTYLITAHLKDGPAAWAKVEVKAGDRLTHDFKLEEGRGAVEVTTPDEYAAQVRLVPSELIPADDVRGVGERVATQLRLGGSEAGGKVVVKNVPPGTYTLFTYPLGVKPRGTVEVKAGETAKAEIKDVK